MTSRNSIRNMISKVGDVDFVIIVIDTFDYTVYAVGCTKENFKETYEYYKNLKMSRIMEVYDLSLDLEMQLRERRARHFPEDF